MERYLGLDLGGTNIKWVVIGEMADGPPEVVATGTVPTHAEAGPDAVVARLGEVGSAAIAQHGPVAAAGVGVPGLFDPHAGTILLFPNLPGPWKDHPLRDPLAEALEVPVTMINDARAFTLAEGTVGAGKGCDTLVCITLGTGVGGGVMIGGRLHLGAFGVAGEIGHQTVLPDGPRCGCGNRGCVEVLTQASALTRAAGRATPEEVYREAAEGDRRCREAIDQVAAYLGIGLANTVTVLGPDRIVVGGGIVAAGEMVLGPIREAVLRRVTLVPTDRIEVVAAELGPIAGAIGAALAARPATAVHYRLPTRAR